MSRVRGLSLTELTRTLSEFHPVLTGDASVALTDVCQDSRQLESGALYVVRVGERNDGRSFIDAALAAGARAVMAAHDTELPALTVPILRVNDVRRALGFAAEAVHGFPSRSLALVGITGTNGKTTTACLLRQCLELLGHPSASIGTLGFEFAGHVDRSSLTTPEACAVSRFLARVLRQGGTHAAMEVSSHALEQGRVDALRFDVAALTNLTQDHLDYHHTFDRYGSAKARLFRELAPRRRVLNIGDEFGAKLMVEHPKGALSVSFSGAADVGYGTATSEAYATQLTVDTPAGAVEIRTRLVGAHNVENWLTTIAVVHALGLDVHRLTEVAPFVLPAPGRLERCEREADDITALVDYAHTPDALRRALETVRELALSTGGRVWCVFGCGGDRDAAKRPQMGAVAGRLADVVIVTNDNPRTEAPEVIAAAIEVGMRGAASDTRVCLDRERAILQALSEAQPGDVVLIAGKGHEDYQLIGDRSTPFDDREVARRGLERRRKERG
jgi:UDP-N-acetylmuramoyl-L-alanyl-D-glutamate--2,6-diaminopimelate ligase